MNFINEDRYLTDEEMLNNASIVYDYLIGKGWSKNSVCAVLGNMQEESTINPGLHERGGDGYGLVQWTPSNIIKDWIREHGKAQNDGYAQLDKILEEVHDGSQWIKTSRYNLTFEDFTHSNESLEFLVNAFMCNYERPATTNHPVRIEYAHNWYDRLQDIADYTLNINRAVDWMISIANDNSHGYDQSNRWGVDYDCSSLVIQAYENAGIPVKTKGATYTGNMAEVCTRLGFKNVIAEVDISTGAGMKKGDIILASSHHVSCYVGDYNGKSKQVVSAHINELGTATGGQTGDQTGHEIDISDYYTFSNIDFVLRLPSSRPTEEPEPPENDDSLYDKIITKGYPDRALTDEEREILKTIKLTDSVKIKHSFNKRKSYYGINFLGKRLTSTDKKYKILDVDNKGFISLTCGDLQYWLVCVNPKFVYK